MTDKTRSTLESVILGLLVIFLLRSNKAFLLLAILLLIAVILKRQELNWLADKLERLGKVLGNAISSAVLAVCYVVIIIPYGFFYRRYVNARNYSYYFKRQDLTYYIVTEKREFSQEYFKRLW